MVFKGIELLGTVSCTSWRAPRETDFKLILGAMPDIAKKQSSLAYMQKHLKMSLLQLNLVKAAPVRLLDGHILVGLDTRQSLCYRWFSGYLSNLLKPFHPLLSL
ncbi:MAG: hypothetical protein ABIO88_14270 [Burkholderiaceae bacterium]